MGLSHNAMNAGRVIVVSYVLSRTHRIHQIAITEIARIICSVEPEMLHHFYDEHRTELRYVWPGQASLGCCWLYYASKILMGRDGDFGDNILPDNEDNKLLSVADTMSEHSH